MGVAVNDESNIYLEDIYSSVILRALYHYNSMNDIERDLGSNFYKIVDYAFHLRSFVELITALPLWFDHPYYTADMPIEAFKDFTEYFSWAQKRIEKGIEVHGLKDTKEVDHIFEKINLTLPKDTYSIELKKVKEQRKEDPFYEEGFKYLSKFIHADEFSIFITSDKFEKLFPREIIISFLKHLKWFWLQEFHHQLHEFYKSKNKAEIDLNELCDLPFDITQEASFKKTGLSKQEP